MSRSSNHVPAYCLHRPSGRAYVRIRGRVRYCGTYGTPESKAEYGRLIAEFAASPDTTAPVSTAATITVVEVADAYWAFAQRYYRKPDGAPAGWLHHIHLALTEHLCRLYGRTSAVEFGTKAFKAIRKTLIDVGHSCGYINKLMPIITRAFKWAASEEMLPASVYHALRTVEGLRLGRTAARETVPVEPVGRRTG